MSGNAVTFSRRDFNNLSVRGVLEVVEVDGRAAPWLELLEIRRRPGPHLNEARFRIVADKVSVDEHGGRRRFEDVVRSDRPGQRVRVSQICDAVAGGGLGSGVGSWPWFEGVICQGQAKLSVKVDEVEVVACSELVYRDGAVIDGVRCLGGQGDVVHLNLDAVFNPEGVGNCSAAAVAVEGESYQVFDLNESGAVLWTFAAAVKYVVSEYLGRDAAGDLSVDELEQLSGGGRLRDVDVTGLTPLKALARLCERAGMDYGLVEVPEADGRVRSVLRFYRQGSGRRIFLGHQRAGEKLDVARTNLVSCQLRRRPGAGVLGLIGRGERKRFEATFELVEGWDAGLEVNDYDLYSPDTNEDFLAVRDVFRKWVLNEAGDYSGSPFSQGPAYDLREVFGGGNYNAHRRRFWPCLSRDAAGSGLGYYLEVSYSAGQIWRKYSGAFDNLLDECGVYLSGRQMDVAMWYAIKKGLLRFRITASIVADESLEAEVFDGAKHSSLEVRKLLFDYGRDYRYEQVTPRSIFYNYVAAGLGAPAVRDDGAGVRALLRDQMRRIRQSDLSGRAELGWLRPEVCCGDVVAGIAGREVDFAELVGTREFLPQVRQVRMVLGDKWTTEIEFGNQ